MATTSEHPPEESTQLPSETPQTALYEKLNTYPFDTDPEFAKGLSIILGHPDSPATREEANRDDDLVLQAKCFYFSRCVACSRFLVMVANAVLSTSRVTGKRSYPRPSMSRLIKLG